MYDTIKEIKDYYASVYDLAKKYEGNHSADYGNNYDDIKISIDGAKNNFIIKILYEDHEYCVKEIRTSDITISFLDDGIFIDINIHVESKEDPELNDSALCRGNNLSVSEFIDKLKKFRGEDIYFLCCDGTVDEIIKGMIDLYKE